MRIALVTETFLPSIDGVVTRLTKGIDYLVQQGHEVLVLAPDFGCREYKGAKVIGMPTRKLPFYRSREFSYPTKKVDQALDNFQPDLIHVANPILLGASAVTYAQKKDLPLLCSYHTHLPKYLDYYHCGFLKPLLWLYLRKMHNGAELNLCTSKTMEEELNKNGIKNVHVLQRGVDLTHRDPTFKDLDLKEKLQGGDPSKKLLLFVGRLAPEKEIHRLLPLLKLRKDIRLVLAGDGPVRQELEELFKGTDTIFTGFIKGQELSSLYASCDAFVFPSISETLGLVLLEAMASGLPVIAAKSGPTLEQIRDGENGLIFHPEDAHSLSEALNRLEDISLKEKLIENGLKEAQENSWERASEHLENYYNTCIHSFQSGLLEELPFIKKFREVKEYISTFYL